MNLEDHLHSQDISLREAAAEFISKSDSRSVVLRLVAALSLTDPYVSIRAAWGLSLMKPTLVVPYLSRTLYGRDIQRAKQAAWALGRMESLLAQEVLVNALADRGRFVRNLAAGGLWIHVLSGYRSPLVERLLAGMLEGDNGQAALTLRHMRGRHRTPALPRSHQTFFQRMGGDSIR